MAVNWTDAQSVVDSDLQAAVSKTLDIRDNSLGQLANYAGAIVSLALIAGIGVWGYDLFKRDVSGVPVVRAVEGDMRVAPSDPGGEQAAHQGLAVNSVAAEGFAEKPADRLILAPRPVELEQEDVPIPSLIKETTAETAVSDAKPISQNGDVIQAAVQSDTIDALVAELTNGVQPLGNLPVESDSAAVSTSLSDTASGATISVAADTPNPLRNVPGVKQSLRPRNRPAGGATVTLASAAAPVGASSVPLMNPENITPGTRMVQLGAYDSEEVALVEWNKLSIQFSDYFAEKQSVIQRASSGGRVFYRLRAVGFDDLSDARRFCSALVAERADCIPVVAR